VVAGTLWRGRRGDAGRIAAEFGLAAAVGFAAFATWAIAADAATGGRFSSQGVRHEMIDRVLAPLEGHGGHPLLWLWFYPAVLIVGFAPWSASLLAALGRLWRSHADGDRLLAWWIGVPFVAFSLAATHLPHYVLPAWPALALAAAVVVDAAIRPTLAAAPRR